MITQPAVPATGTATTNLVTNTTGMTAYVTISAGSATMTNYYVNGVSVATSAEIFMATVPPGGTISLAYTGGPPFPTWYWTPFTPAVPASGTAVLNNTGQDLSVVILGGTVTNVNVNATSRATATPAYVGVPAGTTITLTYSAAPVWAWLNYLNLDLLDSLGGVYNTANTIAPTGTAGYSVLTNLAYAQHGATGSPGFGTGIAN
jgi:hypothetical protein